MDKEKLRRQAGGHIESLRLAGVEWLPAPVAGAAPPRWTEAASPEAATAPLQSPATIAPAAAAVVAEISPEDKRIALQLLAQEVSKCERCPELVVSRTRTVFADGACTAELCFIGEAPGADEDAQGVPFVGAAGQLLNKIIVACGLKREDVYICNILKCRPPGNRTPLPDEAARCRGFLDRQLELVRPRFICALGACAAQNLLNTTISIGKLRGRFHDYRGIPVLATYHPAFLLRSPDNKKFVWEDMKLMLAKMGRPIPAKSS
ncbi:MAG: uracil-DNA glycosylase [Planctomycetes bacterium]|nr:uracil-DNA glycosylase [Planctomycetota bacterium]